MTYCQYLIKVVRKKNTFKALAYASKKIEFGNSTSLKKYKISKSYFFPPALLLKNCFKKKSRVPK